MAKNAAPGLDVNGNIDPNSVVMPMFVSTAARDTFVTANGGTAGPLAGKFLCVVDTGAAWTIHYLTAAGLWKTATLA